jgi:hypothetical protein
MRYRALCAQEVIVYADLTGGVHFEQKSALAAQR